jgi:CheY-like chemotaxis protein
VQVKLALYVHSLLLMYAHVRHDAALCTVLYVEDNPANLQLVEQLIARRPNIRLLSAGDATLGIELAREQQPEAILMDINLPGISGIKALQILREDPLTQHIPVVAVSANQSIPRHRLLRIGNGPKRKFSPSFLN